jgi:hypothetical protein
MSLPASAIKHRQAWTLVSREGVSLPVGAKKKRSLTVGAVKLMQAWAPVSAKGVSIPVGTMK